MSGAAMGKLITFPIPNIVNDFFKFSGETLDNYNGFCGPLTFKVSNWLRGKEVEHKRLMITRAPEEGDELYPIGKHQPNACWYHAIIVVKDMVHCPWLNERLSIEDYCVKMFPGQRVIVEEDYNCCSGEAK